MAAKTKDTNRFIRLRNISELPDSAFVSLPTIAALLDASEASIWRWSRAGFIPSPVYFNHSARWNVGQLREALGGRK